MDLIDADALTAEILSDENQRADRMQFERYAEMVKRQPTVDAVPVVRCKDCMHFRELGSYALGEGSCWKGFLSPKTVKHNDFCSYGERRKE